MSSDAIDFCLPDASWNRRFRRSLLTWFRRNARDLPWRRNRDPYRIWISEVMLQQTQVETVKPYFNRFVKRFPRVEVLANADEQEVLRHWEGLGYYRRARQLHRAAKMICDEYGGQFPRDPDEVRALPVLVGIRPEQFFQLLLMLANRSLKVIHFASIADCSPIEMTLERQAANACCGLSLNQYSRGSRPENSIRR